MLSASTPPNRHNAEIRNRVGCSRRNLPPVIAATFIFTLGMTVGVLTNRFGHLFRPISVAVKVSAAELVNISSQNLDSKGHPKPSSHYVVPNIIHFIWFSSSVHRQMSFLNYISVRSAHQIHKPDQIMLHCNSLPSGEWWERLWREVPLMVIHRDPPEHVHGQRLLHMYHSGDIAKMEILIKYGGIYIDYDVIVVNSLNPLRRYDATLGKEKPPKFIAGIIVARSGSTFIRTLYESYRNNYRPWDWDYNCARLPYQLYLRRPDLLHVELHRLTTPDWTDRRKLWNDVIDWSDLYVIHVMGHFDWHVHTPDSIRTINSTFGQAMRYIYYGTSEIIA